MGEIILIIDCDTRVPVDCLLYGALEMYESPEVAILQHGSGVMQVAHNVFENGITYFTNIVYSSIKYGVGIGDVAPFVGHNAFLRWKAVQSIAFVDPSDGETKWWSDAHVSEDFDISLRVQMAGMTCRLATYHHGGFQEGVSLTVYDELNRWEKYAYGCNELVFNPL
jgi:cellulose synthase/poly-beta-1,6-N-acetylglucosamine synthase-like glycosyltransferase